MTDESGPRERRLIWDNHGCLPLAQSAHHLHQLVRYRAAGVHLVSLNIATAADDWREPMLTLSSMRQWLGRHPTEYRLVSTADDVMRCQHDERLGVVFDIEGMGLVQDQVSLVQTFYELGVRWMLIAYNNSNGAGGGCVGPDAGLTAKGRAIIDEMERVGMVLCLSHTGERTASEALEYARKPPIFSHSNPRHCAHHPRNISDELIRRCAHKGGVIGLNGIGPFLGGDARLVERLLNHIRYVADLVGADHVGLSLDYVFDRDALARNIRARPSLYPGITAGIQMVEPEDMPSIADGLARAHFTEAQIRGMLGENWLRIARTVWQ